VPQAVAVAMSTGSGAQAVAAAAAMVWEMAVGEILDFVLGRGHGVVCVGEDVAAAAGAAIAAAAVGEEDTGTELSSLQDAESVGTGASPHWDIRAPVLPAGGMRRRKR